MIWVWHVLAENGVCRGIISLHSRPFHGETLWPRITPLGDNLTHQLKRMFDIQTRLDLWKHERLNIRTFLKHFKLTGKRSRMDEATLMKRTFLSSLEKWWKMKRMARSTPFVSHRPARFLLLMKQLLDMNFAKLREKIGFDRWVLMMLLPKKSNAAMEWVALVIEGVSVNFMTWLEAAALMKLCHHFQCTCWVCGMYIGGSLVGKLSDNFSG